MCSIVVHLNLEIFNKENVSIELRGSDTISLIYSKVKEITNVDKHWINLLANGEIFNDCKDQETIVVTYNEKYEAYQKLMRLGIFPKINFRRSFEHSVENQVAALKLLLEVGEAGETGDLSLIATLFEAGFDVNHNICEEAVQMVKFKNDYLSYFF